MRVFEKELDVALPLGSANLYQRSRPQPYVEYSKAAVKRMCYSVIVCGSDPQMSLREQLRSATSAPKSCRQVFSHTGRCLITCTEIYWANVWWLHTTKGQCLCANACQTTPIWTIAICMQKQHNTLWCFDLNKTCLALAGVRLLHL